MGASEISLWSESGRCQRQIRAGSFLSEKFVAASRHGDLVRDRQGRLAPPRRAIAGILSTVGQTMSLAKKSSAFHSSSEDHLNYLVTADSFLPHSGGSRVYYANLYESLLTQFPDTV